MPFSLHLSEEDRSPPLGCTRYLTIIPSRMPLCAIRQAADMDGPPMYFAPVGDIADNHLVHVPRRRRS
jgi:hypothetical protein